MDGCCGWKQTIIKCEQWCLDRARVPPNIKFIGADTWPLMNLWCNAHIFPLIGARGGDNGYSSNNMMMIFGRSSSSNNCLYISNYDAIIYIRFCSTVVVVVVVSTAVVGASRVIQPSRYELSLPYHWRLSGKKVFSYKTALRGDESRRKNFLTDFK